MIRVMKGSLRSSGDGHTCCPLSEADRHPQLASVPASALVPMPPSPRKTATSSRRTGPLQAALRPTQIKPSNIPPRNPETASRDVTERVAAPVSPCPMLQPPASRAPTPMKAPCKVGAHPLPCRGDEATLTGHDRRRQGTEQGARDQKEGEGAPRGLAHGEPSDAPGQRSREGQGSGRLRIELVNTEDPGDPPAGDHQQSDSSAPGDGALVLPPVAQRQDTGQADDADPQWQHPKWPMEDGGERGVTGAKDRVKNK
jgi:hypothetical protein